MSERLRLRFERPHLFSNEHHVVDEGAVDADGAERFVTTVRASGLRAGSSFEIEGRTFHCRSKGLVTTSLVLELEGERIAEFVKKGSRYVSAPEAGRTLALVERGIVATAFDLYDDDVKIGAYEPDGLLASSAHLELPSDTPLPVAVFVGAMAMAIKQLGAS